MTPVPHPPYSPDLTPGDIFLLPRMKKVLKGKHFAKVEFIYRKLCIYSYMLKFQAPSIYSPFDAIHLLRLFSPLLKIVFELLNFDAC